MKNIIEYRDFLRNSKEFDPMEIIRNYKEFAAKNKVFRSLCQAPNQIKTFGLRNRIGTHETGDTPRGEEKLCQALFNTFKPEKDSSVNLEKEELSANKNEPWKIQNYGQHIIDYQTPLKNKAIDKLWGKIDLIGLIQGSPKKKLCLWELKVGRNADSIHFAIMELLIYYSQFDLNSENKENAMKNYQNFLIEAALVRGAGITNNTVKIHKDNFPVLFIAADEIYFKHHDWESKNDVYKKMKKLIERELKLKLEFLQIGIKCSYDRNSKRYFYEIDNEIKFLI